MRVQNIVRNPCPICGNETSLAVIEPHPSHPGTELHTYRCVDCGPVKTTSVLRSTAAADHPKMVAVIPRESVQMRPAAESGRR